MPRTEHHCTRGLAAIIDRQGPGPGSQPPAADAEGPSRLRPVSDQQLPGRTSFLEMAGGAEALSFHGHTLRSAFQPIFSFSHQRLIGQEALLRATDPSGRPVSPPSMFQRCADIEELRALDRACCLLHARGFAKGLDSAQWLFLNVDASAFDPKKTARDSTGSMLDIVSKAGLLPNQVVIELLEAALPDGAEFEEWTHELKRLGFLVALDDFGAGHSNFDRVFRLNPHIVKLDRSVISRAASNKTVSRVMAQMISLLHECGAQVLIEGVETAGQANLALDSDADFVQGYHFERPRADLRTIHEHSREMVEVWASCDERSRLEAEAYEEQVRPYGEALMQVKSRLEAGQPMAEACIAFLQLADADLCYLLDADGAQVGQNVFHKTPEVRVSVCDPFAPLQNVKGARWSRRPYFRRAVAAPGELQVTRPYPTMHSRAMSTTLSVCFTLGGMKRVLCGDKMRHGNDHQD
jgi:EAL domain-containing protein (putative c-di-GMP-specific phosphodiesterase class I)